ncbi:uncharacterized protein [Diadema antillarum]|uniref:uncharacterized protein n=1 Tax=Diadema antillarum TaxID=105358 RepID=UPI003A88BE4F
MFSARIGIILVASLLLVHAQGPDEFDGDDDIIDHGGIKPGECPAEEGDVSICSQPCRGDEDCDGTDKCCQRSCGKSCVPVVLPNLEPEPLGEPGDLEGHVGMCPSQIGATPLCGGAVCKTDSDCDGSERCCSGCLGSDVCMPALQIQPLVILPIPTDPLGPGEGTGEPHVGMCPSQMGAGPQCGGFACRSDSDCAGNQKCCSGCDSGSKYCMPALQIQPPIIPPIPTDPLGPGEGTGEPHVGMCPSQMGAGPQCGGVACRSDSDCAGDQKCCSGCDSGSKYCMPALQIQPPMVIPPKNHFGTCPKDGPANCDGTLCMADMDCPADQKCCVSSCGLRCSTAVLTEPPPPPPPIHAGQCPSVEAAGFCENQLCTHDGQCSDTEKCCVSSCGYHCTPSIIPGPPGPLESRCPEGMEYDSCGTACPLSCDQPKQRPCTRQCVSGCFCTDGKILAADRSDRCVAPNECDAEEGGNNGLLCPPGQHPEPCGTACPLSCDYPEQRPCIKMCVPQCVCDGDTILSAEGSDTCVQPNECGNDARPCQHEREKKLSEGNDNQFVPQCTPDGLYSVVQCHTSVNQCWCADPRTGIVIQGTEVQGEEPDCTSFKTGPPIPVDPSLLNQCPEGKKFADGVKKCIPIEDPGIVLIDPPTYTLPAECLGDLVYKTCGTNCEPTCWEPKPEACVAMCVQGCFCPDGMVRLPGSGDCVASLDECPPPPPTPVAIKPCPVLLEEVKADGILIGEFVPECTEEGKYAPIQCHGSTGYCWCVDIETGIEIEGTSSRGRPICPLDCPAGQRYMECGTACEPSAVRTQIPSFVHSSVYQDASVKKAWLRMEMNASCLRTVQTSLKATPVAIKPCPVLLEEVKADGILIGEFVPECTEEGKYAPIQCHGRYRILLVCGQ